MNIKVRLRQKPIQDNKLSLYLDFYPAIPHPKTGKPTRRDFLKMFIYAPVETRKRKQKDGSVKEIQIFDPDPAINDIYEVHNKETLQRAEQIRQITDNKINKPEIYTDFEKERLKIKEQGEKDFLNYFKQLTDERKTSNHANWISTYYYLFEFSGGSLKFADLDKKFCDDFKYYLLHVRSRKSNNSKLSQNTAASFFNKFKEALKSAYSYDMLQTDLNAKVKSIPLEETIKNTLTIEELNLLVNTHCPSQLLKNAALFSALTGLAFKEVQNLTWGIIDVSEVSGIRIAQRRQKTKRINYLYISEQAYQLLGARKKPDDKVFDGINDKDRYYYFPQWIASAGITKKITYHCLRHTYGTLQIDLGTDIYTVQKQMNHTQPSQTQVYAQISDKLKRIAADKIQLDMN